MRQGATASRRFKTFTLALVLAAPSPASAAEPAVPGDETRCSGALVYSDDKDPAGLNIRSGPGMGYAVLGRAGGRHLFMTAFELLGSRNGWFKVRAVGEWDYYNQKMTPLKSFAGTGWVAASRLYVQFEAGQSIPLRSQPGAGTLRNVAIELESSGPQRLLACKDHWVMIENATIVDEERYTVVHERGWIDAKCRPGPGNCALRPHW